ncbi:MAG: PAS domain-containing sensor histidine kinase, partial [Acidobacteriota bacterium]|nr:PAS domain-containing sensor histidine kinase [Acidobacteriota bacterium]
KKLHSIIHHSHFDGSPYPKEDCPIYQAARSGKSAHVDSELFFRLDGTSFPVDYRVHPIVRDGEVRGAITTFTDITERRRTEEAFRQTLERLRFVMESMPQKIFTATASGEVDYFNAQWMEFTGLSFEQIRAWGWTQFIHPDDVQENVEVWKHSLEYGEPFHFEHRFRSKEGQYRWHLSRALPFRDEKGKVLMWIGSNTDVHDKKQAEIALLKSEKLAAVGRLAATIAHEINNPLEAVTNLLYLANKDTSMSERSRSYLQTAGKELDRVALIAQQTLGFYRDRTLPDWVDVSETINELLAVYSYKFRNHDLELKKELDESAKVFASAGEFRQVFSNLFINALDSISQSTGGRIRIRVRSSRDWRNSGRNGVRISIADNGSGISSQHKVKILSLFLRQKKTLEQVSDCGCRSL